LVSFGEGDTDFGEFELNGKRYILFGFGLAVSPPYHDWFKITCLRKIRQLLSVMAPAYETTRHLQKSRK
jgi:hypothetical protein